MKAKKVVKVIGKVLLGILGLAVVLVLGVTIIHAVLTSKEKGELADAGYINTVTVNGKDLNYNAYGNRDGEHVIVTISGLGVDGPYVLLPHSIGGLYATYWECTYPEEIEAIVYLDSTEIVEDAVFEDMGITGMDYVMAVLSKTGLQRLAYDSLYMGAPAWVEEPEVSYIRYLNIHSGGSFAAVSETKLSNENLKFVYEHFTANDIPKMYINATSSFETKEDFVDYIEYANANLTAWGQEEYFDLSDDAKTEEVAQRYIDSSTQWREENAIPFMENVGNCQYVGIPGDHLIYQQKPDEVAEAIDVFLDGLE